MHIYPHRLCLSWPSSRSTIGSAALFPIGKTYNSGQNKYVEATDEGANTLEAFTYMLE